MLCQQATASSQSIAINLIIACFDIDGDLFSNVLRRFHLAAYVLLIHFLPATVDLCIAQTWMWHTPHLLSRACQWFSYCSIADTRLPSPSPFSTQNLITYVPP